MSMPTRTTTMAALASACLLTGPARAEAPPALTGLWKLVSYEVEVRADGKT